MLDLLITVALIQSVDIYTQSSGIVAVVDTIDNFTLRTRIAIFVGGKMEKILEEWWILEGLTMGSINWMMEVVGVRDGGGVSDLGGHF